MQREEDGKKKDSPNRTRNVLIGSAVVVVASVLGGIWWYRSSQKEKKQKQLQSEDEKKKKEDTATAGITPAPVVTTITVPTAVPTTRNAKVYRGSSSSAVRNMNQKTMRNMKQKTRGLPGVTYLPDAKLPGYYKTVGLSVGERLERGEYIASENGAFVMRQEDDGKLIIVQLVGGYYARRVIWESRDAGPIGDYFSVLQDDGNFVTYKQEEDGRASYWWSTEGAGPTIDSSGLASVYIRLNPKDGALEKAFYNNASGRFFLGVNIGKYGRIPDELSYIR